MAFIYRIRKIGTNEYSKGGYYPPKFSKTGKTWTSLNTLSTHLSGYQQSYDYFNKQNDRYKDRYGNSKKANDPYENCEIVKIEILEHSTNSIADAFSRLRKLKELKKKYGEDFALLVDKLDKDENDEMTWIVVAKNKNDFNKVTKNMKIKRADYRYTGKAFAFRNKENAAMFRLSLSGDAYTIYLPDLDENNGTN